MEDNEGGFARFDAKTTQSIGGRKMSGFKQTEIGLIPEDWEVMRLGEIIVYKKGKNQECYLMRGKTVFCHT